MPEYLMVTRWDEDEKHEHHHIPKGEHLAIQDLLPLHMSSHHLDA